MLDRSPIPSHADASFDAELASAYADTRDAGHRAFYEWAMRVRAGACAVPRSGRSYSSKGVLAACGIDYLVFYRDPVLREIIADVVPRLGIARVRSETPEDWDPDAHTLLGMVRGHLADMAAARRKLLRFSATRASPSLDYLADDMGVYRPWIRGAPHVQREVQAWLKDGRIELADEIYEGRWTISRARRSELRAILSADLAGRRAHRGPPIYSHPQDARRIWMARLFEEAGVTDRQEMEVLETDSIFRAELARTIRFLKGKVPPDLAGAADDQLTYRRLREIGETMAVASFRAANPEREPGCREERKYLENERYHLNRFMRENDREPWHAVGTDLRDGFARMVERSMPNSKRAKSNQRRGMLRWVTRFETALGDPDRPDTFCRCLDYYMAKQRKSARGLAKEVAMAEGLLKDWRAGRGTPSLDTRHHVVAMEPLLGLAAGALLCLLGTLPPGRGERPRKLTVDGREYTLSKYWSYLPEDAPTWKADRLGPAVVEVHREHFVTDSRFGTYVAAAIANHWKLPAADPSSPIWADWADLEGFKSGMTDDERLSDTEWGSKTAEKNRKILDLFSRWAMLSREQGGLGLAPQVVGLALAFETSNVDAHVAWLMTRAMHMKHKGEELGVLLTSGHVAIYQFFKSLFDLEFGYVIQSSDGMAPPVEIAETHRPTVIRITDTSYEVAPERMWKVRTIMPAATVALVAHDRKEACMKARRHYKAKHKKWQRRYDIFRDTKALVRPILDNDNPLACALRLMRQARTRVPPIETAPVQHARMYMQMTAMLLVLFTVFRSDTIRNVTCTGPRNALTIRGDEVEVVVNADAFKNWTNETVLGPRWRRRDYHRFLKDWGELNAVLSHYLKHCRPILLQGRSSDLLFPHPSGKAKWTSEEFYQLIRSFTRRHFAYNRAAGTGMPGVKAFGPHIIRDILATTIVRTAPEGVDRFQLAADVLCCDVKYIRTRYADLDVATEIARVDVIFDQQDALARSDQALW